MCVHVERRASFFCFKSKKHTKNTHIASQQRRERDQDHAHVLILLLNSFVHRPQVDVAVHVAGREIDGLGVLRQTGFGVEGDVANAAVGVVCG